MAMAAPANSCDAKRVGESAMGRTFQLQEQMTARRSAILPPLPLLAVDGGAGGAPREACGSVPATLRNGPAGPGRVSERFRC